MSYREFTQDIIKRAGEMALNGRRKLTQLQVETKQGRVRDLVSEIDKQIEQYLRQEINKYYPKHGIIGEEFAQQQGDCHTWVVDPIDGTVSYLRGQPYFSISIALFKGDDCELGMVYAPALNELFIAERGKGAFCNGDSIAVSTITQLDRSIWATGMACLRDGIEPNNTKYLPSILPHLGDFRRMGSAAVDLAYVAAGRCEGFWEIGLNLYDIAAGALLVVEAGGMLSDLYGGRDNYPQSILASNGELHQEMLNLFKQIGLPREGW